MPQELEFVPSAVSGDTKTDSASLESETELDELNFYGPDMRTMLINGDLLCYGRISPTLLDDPAHNSTFPPYDHDVWRNSDGSVMTEIEFCTKWEADTKLLFEENRKKLEEYKQKLKGAKE